MAEIDDVRIGETIAVEWGNAIRDRTIQRYADAAERDELHPNPSEGDLSYLEDSNSIEVYDGFSWVAGIPNGAVTTAKIANEAVTQPKIAPEAVTATRLAPEAVTFSRIADGAVIASKIANGNVITAKIADQAVTEAKIADQAVTQPKIAPEAVTATRLAPEAVTFSRIADGAVITSKIADQAVTQPKIAPEAVTFSRIAGNAISAFERSGATVESGVNVPLDTGTLATVTLNIPTSWSSWECVVFAQATADTLGGTVDNTILLNVRIDGTDGPTFQYRVPGAGATAAAAASFRSGITTTGTRTIALRGNRVSSGGVLLPTVFLYARAFRTS